MTVLRNKAINKDIKTKKNAVNYFNNTWRLFNVFCKVFLLPEVKRCAIVAYKYSI